MSMAIIKPLTAKDIHTIFGYSMTTAYKYMREMRDYFKKPSGRLNFRDLSVYEKIPLEELYGKAEKTAQ